MKTFDELTITDDFMFCAVMRENPALCKELLATLLDMPVEDLHFLKHQQPIQLTPDSHGVRFDIYVGDNKNTIYDIEMQNVNVDDIRKRSRYYQSMIDADTLKTNRKYASLKESYVIFICNFDLFGKKHIVYNFSYRSDEDTSILLNDGTHKIFVNLLGEFKNDVSPKLKAVINYLAGRDTTSDLAREFESAVRRVKTGEDWRSEYVNLYEMIEQAKKEGYDAGVTEGHAAGHAVGVVEGHAAGVAEGHAAGVAEGIQSTSLRTYNNCINLGMTKEQAIAISEIDPKDIPE